MRKLELVSSRVILTLLAILAIAACDSPIGPETPSLESVAAPSISPNGGTFAGPQDVTISCETSGAIIRYTLDGSDPSGTSTIYSTAFQVTATSTVKARASKSGMADSTVTSANFAIETPASQVATPVIAPAAGAYASAQTVTMTCATDAAEIRYTTNGSNPTAASNLYTTGFVVSATTTVKARAYKAGLDDSAIATSSIVIDFPDVEPVTITLIENTRYDTYEGQWFTWFELDCPTSGAELRYTLDGTEPTEESALYDPEANNVVLLDATLKARAFRPGMDPSAIATRVLPDLVGTVSGTLQLSGALDMKSLRIVLSDSTATNAFGLAEFEMELMSEESVDFELKFLKRAGNAYLHAWCDVDENWSLSSGDFLGYYGGSGSAAPASPNVSTALDSVGKDFATAIYGTGMVKGTLSLPSPYDLTGHSIGVLIDNDTDLGNGFAESTEFPAVVDKYSYSYEVACAPGTLYAYAFVFDTTTTPDMTLTHIGYHGSATGDPGAASAFTLSVGGTVTGIDIDCVAAP